MPDAQPMPTVGQLWSSRDRRDHGRTVTVLTTDDYPAGYCTVQSLRKSRMRISTLRGGYRLVTPPVTTNGNTAAVSLSAGSNL